MADKRFIAFRLRKQTDDDLYDRLKDLDSETKSDLIRTALRREFGLTTQKVIEVREVPLPQPRLFTPRRG